MKWQRNPESIAFGTYIYKRRNTDTPTVINISIEDGIPDDTRGWWLGPLNLQNAINRIECICQNCKCWMRTGNSPHGRCHRFPPMDNNWSKTHQINFCYEFIPNPPQEDTNE